MKMEMFILGRNSILLRVENIGDTFDSYGRVLYQTVRIRELVDQLYKVVNGDSASFTATIEELSLSANMPLQEMLNRKIQWQTVDDATVTLDESDSGLESDFTIINLQQQRLRVFKVDYTVAN
jgi:hypothetical protein